MNIGLLGFEFESANKGCEALGYSFIHFINENFKNEKINIYYFSNNKMGTIQEYFPNINIIHINLKIKDLSFKMIRALKKCDYVFDVTMGDSFSDIYSKNYCLDNMKFKLLAEIFAKKYILLPQTYGPFKDVNVLKKAKNILKKADAIFCRDELSMKYIENENVKNPNVYLTTDMAFMLPYNKDMYKVEHEKFNLGINVSGLLWKGGFNGKNQFDLKFSYEEYINKILEKFSEKENIKIHLISHVIDLAENAHDDDYKVCLEISKLYKNVEVAPVFRNPIEAKSYIAQMDCLIASRMHATIASFSAGVPTIPVSYSRKFEGLFDSLEYPYLIHALKDDLKTSVDNTLKYIDDVNVLKDTIDKRMELINKKIEFFTEKFSQIVK